MTIIEGLVAEHRTFLAVFDEIERALPGVKTMDEMTRLCQFLERLLHNHGETEKDLAYIALDHILKQHDQLTRLYHDHQELDILLKDVEKIKDIDEARTQFKKALDASRAHFKDEERTLFPLIETALQIETLQILGKVWKAQSHLSKRVSIDDALSPRNTGPTKSSSVHRN